MKKYTDEELRSALNVLNSILDKENSDLSELNREEAQSRAWGGSPSTEQPLGRGSVLSLPCWSSCSSAWRPALP